MLMPRQGGGGCSWTVRRESGGEGVERGGEGVGECQSVHS